MQESKECRADAEERGLSRRSVDIVKTREKDMHELRPEGLSMSSNPMNVFNYIRVGMINLKPGVHTDDVRCILEEVKFLEALLGRKHSRHRRYGIEPGV